MNLVCPHCRRRLQVPDRFAGQIMACGCCSGSFQVPAALPPEVPGGSARPPFSSPARQGGPPSAPREPFIGIDFGTTNSSVARVTDSGEVELARFATGENLTDSWRSLLYFEQIVEGHRKTVQSWTGPEGIERYLLAEHKGRLIQSLKSFLSSRSLHSTEVFGRRKTLEALIAQILKDLREKAGEQFGIDGHADTAKFAHSFRC